MSKAIRKVIKINSRITSMQMDNLEWLALKDISSREDIARNRLIEFIENNLPPHSNLTRSVRLFLVCYYMAIVPQPKSKISKNNQLVQAKKVLEYIK